MGGMIKPEWMQLEDQRDPARKLERMAALGVRAAAGSAYGDMVSLAKATQVVGPPSAKPVREKLVNMQLLGEEFLNSNPRTLMTNRAQLEDLVRDVANEATPMGQIDHDLEESGLAWIGRQLNRGFAGLWQGILDAQSMAASDIMSGRAKVTDLIDPSSSISTRARAAFWAGKMRGFESGELGRLPSKVKRPSDGKSDYDDFIEAGGYPSVHSSASDVLMNAVELGIEMTRERISRGTGLEVSYALAERLFYKKLIPIDNPQKIVEFVLGHMGVEVDRLMGKGEATKDPVVRMTQEVMKELIPRAATDAHEARKLAVHGAMAMGGSALEFFDPYGFGVQSVLGKITKAVKPGEKLVNIALAGTERVDDAVAAGQEVGKVKRGAAAMVNAVSKRVPLLQMMRKAQGLDVADAVSATGFANADDVRRFSAIAQTRQALQKMAQGGDIDASEVLRKLDDAARDKLSAADLDSFAQWLETDTASATLNMATAGLQQSRQGMGIALKDLARSGLGLTHPGRMRALGEIPPEVLDTINKGATTQRLANQLEYSAFHLQGDLQRLPRILKDAHAAGVSDDFVAEMNKALNISPQRKKGPGGRFTNQLETPTEALLRGMKKSTLDEAAAEGMQQAAYNNFARELLDFKVARVVDEGLVATAPGKLGETFIPKGYVKLEGKSALARAAIRMAKEGSENAAVYVPKHADTYIHNLVKFTEKPNSEVLQTMEDISAFMKRWQTTFRPGFLIRNFQEDSIRTLMTANKPFQIGRTYDEAFEAIRYAANKGMEGRTLFEAAEHDGVLLGNVGRSGEIFNPAGGHNRISGFMHGINAAEENLHRVATYIDEIKELTGVKNISDIDWEKLSTEVRYRAALKSRMTHYVYSEVPDAWRYLPIPYAAYLVKNTPAMTEYLMRHPATARAMYVPISNDREARFEGFGTKNKTTIRFARVRDPDLGMNVTHTIGIATPLEGIAQWADPLDAASEMIGGPIVETAQQLAKGSNIGGALPAVMTSTLPPAREFVKFADKWTRWPTLTAAEKRSVMTKPLMFLLGLDVNATIDEVEQMRKSKAGAKKLAGLYQFAVDVAGRHAATKEQTRMLQEDYQ